MCFCLIAALRFFVLTLRFWVATGQAFFLTAFTRSTRVVDPFFIFVCLAHRSLSAVLRVFPPVANEYTRALAHAACGAPGLCPDAHAAAPRLCTCRRIVFEMPVILATALKNSSSPFPFTSSRTFFASVVRVYLEGFVFAPLSPGNGLYPPVLPVLARRRISALRSFFLDSESPDKYFFGTLRAFFISSSLLKRATIFAANALPAAPPHKRPATYPLSSSGFLPASKDMFFACLEKNACIRLIVFFDTLPDIKSLARCTPEPIPCCLACLASRPAFLDLGCLRRISRPRFAASRTPCGTS